MTRDEITQQIVAARLATGLTWQNSPTRSVIPLGDPSG
jgi:hypothetical protein